MRKVTYKFESVRDQRDMFILMMDHLRYGMFDDDLEIGPFDMKQFTSGIWVRGPRVDVKEFIREFETQLGKRKYKKVETEE